MAKTIGKENLLTREAAEKAGLDEALMPVLLESAPNFRDLGGLQTADGDTIPFGRLFRSQALFGLSDDDADRLKALDFGLVCDLRSPGERLDSPNAYFDPLRTAMLVPEPDERLSAVRATDWRRHLEDPGFDQGRATQMMIDAYRAMPAAMARVLAGIFEHCQTRDDRPLLIHCAAGKDRTGFVVAMLLWALGIPYRTILENYLASGEIFWGTGRSRALLDQLFPAGAPAHAEAAALAVFRVQPTYLEAALAQVATKDASIDDYLRDAAGLSEARRELFRHRLLR